MLTIYGFPISTCTKRVALILTEMEVSFHLETVKPEQFKAPVHLKRQPFGQIPVMDDGGYHLYESRAIARYICAKPENATKTKLVPPVNDFHALGKFEQACSIEYSQFSPLVDRIMKEVIFPKQRNKTVNAELEATLKAGLEAKLDVYDKILKNQKYLAGEDVTLADLFHLPECALICDKFSADLIMSREHVARWFRSLSARPSWNAVKDGVQGNAQVPEGNSRGE